MVYVQLRRVLDLRRDQYGGLGACVEYACYRAFVVRFAFIFACEASTPFLNAVIRSLQAPGSPCDRPGTYHHLNCNGAERDNRRAPARRLPRAQPVVLRVLAQLLQRRQPRGALDVLVWDPDIHWL